MPKAFQANLDLRSEDLASGLLDACAIDEPPTDDQLVFDFLKLKREALPFDLVDDLRALKVDPEVRAILRAPERLVFIHPEFFATKERYTWASLHEVGHYVLPEHRELIFECSWKDLAQSTQRRLENEANKFSADLIFQNELFTKEASDHKLSLKVPVSLRDRYGASFEATIRRYVERNPRPCALVVYRPTQDDTGFEAPLEVHYSVRSPSWTHFSYIVPHQKSSADSPEHRALYEKQDDNEIIAAEFITGDARSTKKYDSEMFSNRYKVFQLIHPPE